MLKKILTFCFVLFAGFTLFAGDAIDIAVCSNLFSNAADHNDRRTGKLLKEYFKAELATHSGIVISQNDAMLEDEALIRRRGKNTAVFSGSSNRASVHKSNGSALSRTGLGALSVREVAGGVAEAEALVGGNVACTEARSAECGAESNSGLHKRSGKAVSYKVDINGLRCGVCGKSKRTVSDRAAL